MANLVVTTDQKAVKVDFGIYAGIIGYKKSLLRKDGILIINQMDEVGYFRVEINSKHNSYWSVSHDGIGATLKIDSIDGVAPTDSDHLYNLLVDMIKQ